MNTKLFNKTIIENFAVPTNEQYINELVRKCGDLINNVLIEIKSKRLSIINHKVVLLDEFATRTNSDRSNVNLLLAISSAEIQVATNQFSRKKFLTTLTKFFSNFKIKFKNRKDNANKIDKQIEKLTNSDSYSMYSLKENLYLLLSKYSPKTTTIIFSNNCITLKDQVEYGNKCINIYLALQTDNDNYLVYDNNCKFPIRVMINKRIENFANQYSLTKGKNIQILKILNCTYSALYKKSLNQVYAESLVFNCKNEIFNESNSLYDCFLNFVNYLDNTNQNNINSINGNIKLFSDRLNTVSHMMHMSFINKLKENL